MDNEHWPARIFLVRILLIEDEGGIAEFVVSGLTKQGYNIDHASDGTQGLEKALSTDYDLVILDLVLPDFDGIEILQKLRAAGRATRVLILTQRAEVQHRVQGLESGADGYLPKPFDLTELIANVKALLRRTPLDLSASLLRVGDLELDTRRKYVTRGGTEIHLPAKQLAILEHLMRRPNQVVTRQDLARSIWASEPETTNNVIDVTVHLLRESVDKGYPSQLIRTIRGVGYQIGPVAATVPSASALEPGRTTSPATATSAVPPLGRLQGPSSPVFGAV